MATRLISRHRKVGSGRHTNGIPDGLLDVVGPELVGLDQCCDAKVVSDLRTQLIHDHGQSHEHRVALADEGGRTYCLTASLDPVIHQEHAVVGGEHSLHPQLMASPSVIHDRRPRSHLRTRQQTVLLSDPDESDSQLHRSRAAEQEAARLHPSHMGYVCLAPGLDKGRTTSANVAASVKRRQTSA